MKLRRLAAAAAFRETRQELQAIQAARLAAGLPLPQLLLAVPVHG